MQTGPEIRRVLVTGATGFVGRHACTALKRAGMIVRATKRPNSQCMQVHGIDEWVEVADLGAGIPEDALSDVDAVVHLAARVHVMNEDADGAFAAFRRMNVGGTEALARRAAGSGVRRLVFMSSIKVNGESTNGAMDGRTQRYSETNRPQPTDAYGRSKWEAEQVLERISRETGLQVMILRPPLVYGPGVGANFLHLMQWIAAGRPLPFGSVQNLRSLIFVGNLANAVQCCLRAPMSTNRTYLVSDVDISTPDLIRAIAHALGVRAHCFRFPPVLLRAAAAIGGQADRVSRLLDSLVVDSDLIRREMEWRPPYTLEQGLGRTAEWFKKRG